jgi:hypothetical protein
MASSSKKMRVDAASSPSFSASASSSAAAAGAHVLAPERAAAKVDTSAWPLLLKGYDKLNVRTGHYTPIPSGHPPLKRPFGEHVKTGCSESTRRRRLKPSSSTVSAARPLPPSFVTAS